jgi:polyisoprenoid-binding protein YceI
MAPMSLSPGVHKVGPENANLVVKTYREGVAAKAGHDLIIEVTDWEATLEVGDAPKEPRLELSADARSLHPREGLRGVKPLSDKDRGEIRKNIDEKVLGGETIRFSSTAVEESSPGRLSIQGDLMLRGVARPASFELEVNPDGTVAGTAELVQSDWGIKPYRGLMGALKVRDSLEVVFEGRLPAR